MPNPRYALLLQNYLQYDTMTLALAGIAALAVLIGFACLYRSHSSFDRLLQKIYFALALIIFAITLAGVTYFLIRGGYS